MRPRPFLLLITGFALVLMAAGEADADKEPLWNYTTSKDVNAVSISADGEYIAAGAGKVYLFDKNVPVFVEKSSGDDDDDDDDDDESFFQVQVGTLVVLGLIYRLRRDTSSSDGLNKMLRIGLYGMAILLFLIAVIMGGLSSARTSTYENGELVQDDEYLVSDSGDRKIWIWWMAYAILFAVTGSFLGQDLYDPGPSYRSSSTSPSAPPNPIFARRQATPMFTPENELTAIECPGCNARMEVPKLGTMQKVTCDSCGLSGEIEV